VEFYFTTRFERALEKLSIGEQRSIDKTLLLLGENPHHPGLHVKKMEGVANIWEARTSRSLRITFKIQDNFIVLRNVGEHGHVLKNT
jgi:mRNA-degrading endonuclease RelE of RelBE toxin-antitoxin system